MHEILVILKKDVRRLWWQIGAAAAMSATAGCLDARRAAAQPGVVEGLLNVLLPLAWAFLIAQAVHGEALVGDREFWMTRPYRWGRLLAAKALFAALAVHVPSFLTDAAILAAHGFNPLAALPHLLGKQLLLAGRLTLPAMALAALVSNLTQFVIVVPILLLATAVWMTPPPRFPFGHIGIAVLAVAAVSVMLLQYRRRRTGLARIVAVLGGLAAGALCALGVVAGVRTTRHPFASPPVVASEVARIAIGPAPGSRISIACFGETSAPRVSAVIPFVATGFPRADRWSGAWLSLEVSNSNGVRYDSQLHVGAGSPTRIDRRVIGGTHYTRTTTKIENELFAGWSLGPDGIPNALSLSMSRDAYDRLASGKATVAGQGAADIYENPPVRLRVGENREVPGIGRCSVRAPQNPHGYQLTVTCESPSERPMQARVAYEHPVPGGGTGTEKQVRRMQEQVMEGEYPGSQTLLSPLHRGVVYLPVGDPWTPLPADQAVVLVQRISARATAEIRLVDIELPDTGRCRGR